MSIEFILITILSIFTLYVIFTYNQSKNNHIEKFNHNTIEEDNINTAIGYEESQCIKEPDTPVEIFNNSCDHSSNEQYARMCRAVSDDLIGEIISINNEEMSMEIRSATYPETIHLTNLMDCDCKDFKNRHLPCKHMYKLAFELGVMDVPPDPPVIQAQKNDITCKIFSIKGNNLFKNQTDQKTRVISSTKPLILDEEKISLSQPYLVEEIETDKPTGPQIRFAKREGFTFPEDADIRDASIFLSRLEKNEELIKPKAQNNVLEYIINKGIFIPKYADTNIAYNLYFSNVGIIESIAYFGMKVYCNLNQKTYHVLEDATEPERELFFHFAKEYSNNKPFTNSLSHYSGSDIPLDSYKISKKLKAYDIAAEYFDKTDINSVNNNEYVSLDETIDIIEGLSKETQQELLNISRNSRFNNPDHEIQINENINILLKSGLIFDETPEKHQINFGKKIDIIEFLDSENIDYDKKALKDTLMNICIELLPEKTEKRFPTTTCVDIPNKFNTCNIYSYLHRKYDNAILYDYNGNLDYQELPLLNTILPDDIITRKLVEHGYYSYNKKI